jgi:hypothetical protein
MQHEDEGISSCDVTCRSRRRARWAAVSDSAVSDPTFTGSLHSVLDGVEEGGNTILDQEDGTVSADCE